jgi:rSAM/selenodomain-associated transferase 1
MPTALPRLVLFARVPRPGRVKTRLSVALGEAGAARLYEAFLEDAARIYLAPERWSALVAAEPDPEDPALARLFPHPWRRVAQASGDLGSRLEAAFRLGFREGAAAVAAVGSDHPALPRRLLEEALRRVLDGADAALVPAEDGGYCVVALGRRALPGGVFRGIPWSSAGTLRATVQRMRGAGLSVELLETAYDVDRPEDLVRLRRDLAARDPAAADFPRATARELRQLRETIH